MKAYHLLFLPFIFASLYLSAQVNPKTNPLSIDVTTPENSSFTYDSCFRKCHDIGMREIGLHFPWKDIETASGKYTFAVLDIANIYYPAYKVPVDLNIDPIETNQLTMPADLLKLPLDDPKVIKRFKTLLDSVFKHIPSLQLSSLVIGSESDIYLNGDSSKWGQFTRFFDSVSAYARTLRSGIKISTEITLPGMTGKDSTYARVLNAKADYIGVSYYPLNSDFTVKPVSTVVKDLGKVVSLYPSKPIYFYQYGYPSASVCKSSEILQAQFIDETFHAWDSFAKNIRVIDFTWLHDYSPASVKYYSTFYGITDSAFLGYLGSLGLRNYAGNGSDKLAYQELVCQASRHGYNNISCTTGINEAINNAGKINIYPNPFNDHFNIDIPEGNGAGRFILYNSNGQSVLNILVSEGDGIIKTNHLQSGIYFYRLIGKNGSIISDGKLIRI